MKDNIHFDEISSLIDGEITEIKKKEEITEKINSDTKLKFEFLTLKLLKKTLRDKVSPAELSVKQKDELLQKIGIRPKRSNQLSKLSFIQSKRFIAYSTFAVVFLAVALLILNGPPLNTVKNTAPEKSQSQNMFIQAVNNFQNIVSGKMSIQMYSNNPKELQEFFKANGVSYSTRQRGCSQRVSVCSGENDI